MPRRLPLLLSLLPALALCLIVGGLFSPTPAVNDRLYPRVDKFVSDVRELVAPAPETVPTAAAAANLPTFAPDTPTPVLPTVTQTQPPNDPATQQPNNLTTEPPTSTPIPTVYDLPPP